MNTYYRAVMSMAIASALGLAGCSGSNTESASSEETGTLELAITDAEEDFLTYQINLDSISLVKANGTRVELLPTTTEVDFVQYQELSELFAVLSVPAGVYTDIELSLDYSDADIVIQDEEGNNFNATAVDSEGNAIGEIDVQLSLNDQDYLRVRPRVASQLTLDLDLAASNTIESFEPAIVTVEPFMIGTTYLDEEREHRVRGLLDEVAIDLEEVTMTLRPMRLKTGTYGEFTFHVSDDTTYELNGGEFEGQEGLRTLSAMDEDTPIIAYGMYDDAEEGYLATNVLAGSSVPWERMDTLKGIITARSENDITIEGAVIEPEDGAAHFRKTITLEVGDETLVTGYRLGDSTIANLSVGQKVLALGQYGADDTFDATAGNVRMQLNRIVGQVEQAYPLTLDLSYLNKRAISVFDFSGTGVDASSDADPENYEIETSTLDVSGIEENERIQVRGYPSAFASAPQDFDALSIIDPDLGSHPARFISVWSEEAEMPISINSGTIEIDDAFARMKLNLKGIPGALSSELTLNMIQGNGEQGRFAILERGAGIDMYRNFDDFADALAVKITNGAIAWHLTASGIYDDSAEAITANYATVKLRGNDEVSEDAGEAEEESE